MRAEEIRPGDVLAGKYRVRAVLGRGRGLLVDADNLAFEQRVAIRIVSPSLANPVAVEQFRREARVLAKLSSEHVARIIDVGVLPDGAFYLVRQFVEGKPLSQLLSERGALPVAEAVGYALMAAEALAEAHAHGILLRELDTDALFVAERSSVVRGGPLVVKLVDFGTAKLFRDAYEATPEATSTAVLGLSPFSSPEMMRREQNIDPTTDVWSLGAILYAMLAGRPPFGGDVAALAVGIAHETPQPLSRFRRDVAPALEQAVLRCLAKDRHARPATMYELASPLLMFAPPEGRVLVERVRVLSGAPEEDLEISSVEEIDEDDEPATRMVSVAAVPAPKAPPRAPGPPRPPQAVASAAAFEQTTALSVSDALRQAAAPQAAQAPPPPRSLTQEKTEALGFSFQAIDPNPPRSAPSTNAATPSSPGFGPSPAMQPPPSLGFGPPPSSSHAPHASPALGPASAPGYGVAPAQAYAPSYASPAGQAPSQVAMQRRAPTMVEMELPAKRSSNQRVAVYAVGGASVALLIIVLVVLLVPSSETADAGRAASAKPGASAAPSQVVAAATAEAGATAAPTAPSEPEPTSPEPEATNAPSAAPVAATAKTATRPTAPVEARPTAAATATAKPTATTPATTPATAAPPSPGGDGPGTLVAIATGGTCAFSVNGAPKGTTNSLKLSVPPGNYNVTCTPSSGASKSRSVTVKSGSTAMAMFKL